MKRRILLVIMISFFAIISFNAEAQYAFNMTPLKGPYGTYVTLTGSGFTHGKLLAFINSVPVPVVYTTAHHAVVRIPENAQSGKILLQISNSRSRFVFPAEFTVQERPRNYPKNPGLYISAIDMDESASNVFLYHSPSAEGRTTVFALGPDPIDYKEIQSLASGDFDDTNDYETVMAVAQKPYRNNVPVTGIYYSSDVKNLYFGSSKRIYGFSYYRNVNSLDIAPFWGDTIGDLIYCVDNHDDNKTFVYLKIFSMPRDIPLFSVPITLKLRNIRAVDFRGTKKSELTVVYFDKGLWHLALLQTRNTFTPSVVFYKGKSEVTATASGDMDGNGKQELYFATYENDEAKLYVQYAPGNQKLLFTRKGMGKILAISLSDLNRDGREEIACSFHLKTTSTVYYSPDAEKIGLPASIILYKQNNWKVTALASTRY